MLFLEIINKQLRKLPEENPEYHSTYAQLSEAEKNDFHILSPKIHQYWNYINLPKIIPENVKRVQSITEYNDEIEQVDQKILQICNDFELTLKNEQDEKTRTFLKKFLGEKYEDFFDE